MFIQKGCFTDLCSHSSFHENIISGGDIIPYFWVSSSRMVRSPCVKWSEHVHRNRIQGNDPEYQHYMKARAKRKSTFFWGRVVEFCRCWIFWWERYEGELVLILLFGCRGGVLGFVCSNFIVYGLPSHGNWQCWHLSATVGQWQIWNRETIITHEMEI